MSSLQADAVNWLFVDMDSFFASVEQHLRPELRGRPVGVVPVMSAGTCVIAASAEAKRRGVRVGTPVREIDRVCPGIELVQARPPVYVDVHRAVERSIDTCLPIHKAYSIDEWAIRLRGPERRLGRAMELGAQIRARIRADFSEWLSCSVGVAPTRLLAKIACDLEKPGGLTALRVADLPDRLEHLALRDLIGIGRNMEARLHSRGVRTVRALWDLTRSQAVMHWNSSVGGDWWAGFHGLDEPEIPVRKGSMSHANVLEPRFRDADGARRMLTRLTVRLGVRLRREGYAAGRFDFFASPGGRSEGFSAGRDLPCVQDTRSLLEVFYEQWERRPRFTAPLHKVGATVSGLVPVDQAGGPLFVEVEQRNRLSCALDAINHRWGTTTVYFGSMHGCCHHMDDKIAFGRIPPSLQELGAGRR